MLNPQWTIRCYVDANGQDVIDSWYQDQCEELRAKFDSRIRFLRQQPRDKWVRQPFDMLHGDCKGIGEIRFEFKNVAYRPLGAFTGHMEFTLLVVATKKGSRFDPKNACDLA